MRLRPNKWSAPRLGPRFADHRGQLGHPGDALRQPCLTQPPARLVLQPDVVALLGPIIPEEQQP
jgi:hypothetical protein